MKILVIDDHPLIVDALAQLLPQLDAGITMLGAGDPAAAMEVLDNEPDVALVLLDLALPGARGLDFLADLKLDYPGVPIAVLSATHDQATVLAALGAGAQGFIPKSANARALLDAVRYVLDGGVYLPTDALVMPEGDGVHLEPGALGLTARQTDVLKLLVQGKPNKLICRDLDAIGGDRQGSRERDPQGAARALAHGSHRRARPPRHQRRHACGAQAELGPNVR